MRYLSILPGGGSSTKISGHASMSAGRLHGANSSNVHVQGSWRASGGLAPPGTACTSPGSTARRRRSTCWRLGDPQ